MRGNYKHCLSEFLSSLFLGDIVLPNGSNEVAKEIDNAMCFIINHNHIHIILFHNQNPFGDTMSMLTHTYSHKPLRKIKIPICHHQVESPVYIRPDFRNDNLQSKEMSMDVYDTECSY